MAEETKIPIITQHEEAIAAISNRAIVDGDEFRVKILRRSSPASFNEVVATLDGATAEQIANPEPWMTRLAGGCGVNGEITLRVVHGKDKREDKPLAIFKIPNINAAIKTADANVVRDPNWPKNLTLHYAPEGEKKDKANGAVPLGSTPESNRGAPPAHEKGDGSAALLLALQEERAKIADERRSMEIDAIRRAAEEDRKRLEAKVNDLIEAFRQERSQITAPRTSVEETIVKVIGAGAAILSPVLAYLGESSKARESREAAMRERDAMREEKRETERQQLLEKIASNGSESAKMISIFTDSLSQTARAMVQTVAMIGELRPQEPPEEGLTGVLKEAIGAWAQVEASKNTQPRVEDPKLNATPSGSQAATPPKSEPRGAESDTVEGTPEQIIDYMAEAVQGHADVAELAEGFVDAIKAPEFVAALKKDGGPIGALRKRLGDEWGKDPKNLQYLQGLFSKIEATAKARGVNIAAL